MNTLKRYEGGRLPPSPDRSTPRSRTGTLRDRLIGVLARLARSAGRLALHLPQHWPWQAGLDELLRVALHDPLPAAA